MMNFFTIVSEPESSAKPFTAKNKKIKATILITNSKSPPKTGIKSAK